MDDDTSRNGSTAEASHAEVRAGWTVLSYLISGPMLYGGLGWLLDRWLGTQVFTPVGLVGGMALALYVIVKRYVSPPPSDPTAGDGEPEVPPASDEQAP
ncbi:hypothetical protein ACIB24_21585 [Spongisporangium articulatum]|uniref:F0F1-ATPase subunit Ca2+/Mg2+ transporter n=1 Tax=Spongisporangium articulatum TaxID=3362603 RepID=A0ABW8ATF9_9ACTN